VSEHQRVLVDSGAVRLKLGKILTVLNTVDESGNPTGGVCYTTGLLVCWQDGPLGRGDDRKAPNGAFVEDLIQAAISRLEFYQSGKFACRENEVAIDDLRAALSALDQRTRDREARNVEGTHAK